MKKKTAIRAIYGLVLFLFIITALGAVTLIESKDTVFEAFIHSSNTTTEVATGPFPVSVDPTTQTISEEDILNSYTFESFAQKNGTFMDKVLSLFASKSWYQNLASPTQRILVIWPGERKEEVVKYFGDIMRWDNTERAEFSKLITSADPVLAEGKFYPGRYISQKDAAPETVAELINNKFQTDVLSRYTKEVEAKVPLKDALIIASLLEREASDFENMREISGVIWNRLFIGMPLQLDATLQYARGSKLNEKAWWPIPVPKDKYIPSPYNTYANAGLPPAPIANPSAAAILAALNPTPSECLFYFHDNRARYYCSKTYEEHVAKLKKVFGQGR